MTENPHLARRILARLHTKRLGRPLLCLDRVSSTMTIAREICGRGAAPGTVVIALEQSAGRGRDSRKFVSPPGGLYLTAVQETRLPPSDAWRLGFGAALAVRRAIAAVGGPEITFDWPNDLYLGDAKIGGLLLELLSPSHTVSRALIGVGLNVLSEPAALRSSDAGPAGCLPPLLRPDPLAELAAELLASLEEISPRCEDSRGWMSVLESVRAASRLTEGRTVRLRKPDGRIVEGVAVGLADDGALLVKVAEGRVEMVRHAHRIADSSG